MSTSSTKTHTTTRRLPELLALLKKPKMKPVTSREITIAHARWLRQVEWYDLISRCGEPRDPETQEAIQAEKEKIDHLLKEYETLLHRFMQNRS
jgi:hypothetical protein